MMKKALFPGTFDPMTLGHLNLIERAATLVDELVVLVAAPTHKACLFSLEERVSMAHALLGEFKHVTVRPFEGLLVDIAHNLNASLIIRGVRGSPDFEYERQVALVHQKLNPTLETLYLASPPELICVASSFVREIAALKGDVSAFVPPLVAQALQERFNHGA
jgi:pantetheine-phosphate adenylyltransferase